LIGLFVVDVLGKIKRRDYIKAQRVIVGVCNPRGPRISH
jgi:hypothetical protein